jgi:hypothetical protein
MSNTKEKLQYYNPNVLELSATTPDVLLSPTSTPLSYSNPFVSLFIAWQKIFFIIVPHTPTRLFAK